MSRESFSSQASPLPDGEQAINTVWYSRCPAPTASTLAIERGMLAQRLRPLGMTVRPLEENDPGRTAHFRHDTTGLFRDGGNIPPLWAKSRGQDTRVIAINWVREFQVIAVRPEHVLSSQSDLRTRRLAVPRQVGGRVDFYRAMAWRGFKTAFQLQGLDWSQANIVDIDQPQPDYREGRGLDTFHDREALAVQNGQADAVYLKGAVGVDTLRRFGLAVAIDIGEHADRFLTINSGTPRIITVDTPFLRQQPQAVVEYLVALLQAAQWAQSNESAVIAAGTRVAYASEAGVRHGYGKALHQHLMPELSATSIAALQDQATFLLREGFISHAVDVQEWVDPAPLAAAWRQARSR